MKKLMMAAAIVCAAAFANAATVNWNVDYFEDPSGNLEGNYGYLLIDSGSLTGWSTYAINSATEDLKKGDLSFLSNALQDADRIQAVGMDNYGATGLGFANDGLTKVVDNDQTGIRAYLVVIDAADIKDATKALLVAVNENGDPVVDNIGKGGTAENGFQFGDISAYSQNPDNWTTLGAAPEPTSGLLLLLGVAGLALRRRRA